MTSDQVITHLVDRRAELGLTLAQVGERAGMPLQQVWAILNRKTEPRLGTLVRLIDALQLHLEIGYGS